MWTQDQKQHRTDMRKIGVRGREVRKGAYKHHIKAFEVWTNLIIIGLLIICLVQLFGGG